MKHPGPKTRLASHASRHRTRIAAGGEDAELVRRSLRQRLTAPRAKTGAELVAFLRASPLADADLAVERDHSTGRSADLP